MRGLSNCASGLFSYKIDYTPMGMAYDPVGFRTIRTMQVCPTDCCRAVAMRRHVVL
jgi:hypothetical protein